MPAKRAKNSGYSRPSSVVATMLTAATLASAGVLATPLPIENPLVLATLEHFRPEPRTVDCGLRLSGSITASFRVRYVLVVMEVGSRRILHFNVKPHPTAEWTVQQFREAFPSEHAYRFLIRDRDSIFSEQVDRNLKGFWLEDSANTDTSAKSKRFL